MLTAGDRLVALEAKSSHRVDPKDFRGLRAVAELPGMTRRVAVCTGETRRRTEDGIDIPPVAELLAELEAGTLFG